MNSKLKHHTITWALLVCLCGCSRHSWQRQSPPPPLAQQTADIADSAEKVRPASFIARSDEQAARGETAELCSLPLPGDEHLSPVPDSTELAREIQPGSAGRKSGHVMQLDYSEALSIAAGQNPRLALAAARYREAYARLREARTLWLPSIRAGISYNHHDGTLQASDGHVEEVSRTALNGGLGAGAIAAGSPLAPGVIAQFHSADAYYQPKIATQEACARRAATEKTTNDALLDTSLAYLDLLRSKQLLSIALETQANAAQLAKLTATFARTGQGSQADADRMEAELARRRVEAARAEERVDTSSARLAQLLSLDATMTFEPREPTIIPVDLVPEDVPVQELIATGLTQRPELTEAQHLVCEAVYRYRREKYAPLMPSLLLGLSQSGFGGGTGSSVTDSGGRLDLDAAVVWELRQFGFGDHARREATRARYDQARALQASVMDEVAREIVEGHVQIVARHDQMGIAESGVASATDSYSRNMARIREGQGLPIEVLQSLDALDAAQREYVRTLADHNEAQFRLQRAMGWPLY